MSRLTLTWGIRIMVLFMVLVALILVWWGAELFHEVTLRVFSDNPPNVPGVGGTVAAYGTFFGTVSLIVVGMWLAAKKLLIWRTTGEHDGDPK